MPFMTIPEAAVLWHISAAELRQLCENHAILGAVRVHQRWFIPEDAACPAEIPFPYPEYPAPLNRRSFHGTNRLCISTAA